MPDDGLSVDIETSGTTLQPIADAAGDPRRRSHRPHHRPHRHRQSRPRHRRGRARAQAQHRERRCSRSRTRIPSPRFAHTPVPHRRRGAGGGRAAGERCACAATSGSRSIRRRAAARSPRRSRSNCRSIRHAEGRRDLCRSPPTLPISPPIRCCSGQKLEAASLQVDRDQRRLSGQGRRQDQRHAGHHRFQQAARAMPTPTCICRPMLDEAARRRLGINFGAAVTGVIPVKLAGRVGGDVKDDRFSRRRRSDAGRKIDDLLPGWAEAGRQAGARDLHAGQERQIRRASTISDRRVRRQRERHRSNSTMQATSRRPISRSSRCRSGDKAFAQGRPHQ